MPLDQELTVNEREAAEVFTAADYVIVTTCANRSTDPSRIKFVDSVAADLMRLVHNRRRQMEQKNS